MCAPKTVKITRLNKHTLSLPPDVTVIHFWFRSWITLMSATLVTTHHACVLPQVVYSTLVCVHDHRS
jgi:hypothetical protein